MKKLLYIGISLLLMACAEAPERDTLKELEAVETTFEEETTAEAFKYATVTEQKLQEYFDLLIVKNKHPEFSETVNTQLRSFVQDSLLFETYEDSVDVKNLHQIGDGQIVNDSIEKLKIGFTIGSLHRYKTDTVTAYIITNRVMVDGQETRNITITFSQEQ